MGYGLKVYRVIQKNFLRTLHAILFTAPLFKNIFLRHCLLMWVVDIFITLLLLYSWLTTEHLTFQHVSYLHIYQLAESQDLLDLKDADNEIANNKRHRDSGAKLLHAVPPSIRICQYFY